MLQNAAKKYENNFSRTNLAFSIWHGSLRRHGDHSGSNSGSDSVNSPVGVKFTGSRNWQITTIIPSRAGEGRGRVLFFSSLARGAGGEGRDPSPGTHAPAREIHTFDAIIDLHETLKAVIP